MFIEERLNGIMKLVQETSRVTVYEASERLHVSTDTIRRDFSRLAEKGLVLRTHGGIMLKERVSFDPGMNEKNVQHKDEKELIAGKAATLINDSETIILDAGTTTEKIVKHLQGKRNITILTNALNIAIESSHSQLNTIILGGIIRNSTLCITGPDAVEMTRHYHADKLIMGVSAISASRDMMTANRMEAEIKKELLKIANQVIVVADHSKLMKTAFYSFGSLDDVETLITDGQADPDFLKELRELAIEVLIAE